MSNLINELEKEQMSREVPDFRPGDTIVVKVKVKEGSRERLQAFEGVCLARRWVWRLFLINADFVKTP